jgi:hypothetical protein
MYLGALVEKYKELETKKKPQKRSFLQHSNKKMQISELPQNEALVRIHISLLYIQTENSYFS